MVGMIVWILTAAVLSPGSLAVSPGAQIQLSTNGLNYAAKVAVDTFSSRVRSLTIPDQSGESKIGGVGKVEFSFTGNHVTKFTTPGSRITTSPLGLSITNINIALHGDWRYKAKIAFIPVRDHGSFDATLGSSSISVTVGLTMKNGRPVINVEQCSVDIGAIDVHFSGGASWLYNLFHDVVEKNLEKALHAQLSKEITAYVNINANEVLATMKVSVPLEDYSLDYSFLSVPELTQTYIRSKNKGEIFFGSDRTEAPFAAPVMPDLPTTNKMVTIQLSEYIINSFGYAAWKHSKLYYNLTNADFKGKDAGFLNTTCAFSLIPRCIGAYIPELKKAYPDSTVQLNLGAAPAPKLSINSHNMSALFTGWITFMVNTKQGPVFAFMTDTRVSFTVNASIVDKKIKAFVLEPKISLKVTQAAIPISDVKQLEKIVDLAVTSFVIPKLNNNIGEKGMDLPQIDDITYQEPQLILQEGAVTVDTDVLWNPSK